MRTILPTLCAIAALAFGGVAAAQTAKVNLDIKPQPMRAALKAFGDQTGMQVLYRVGDVAKEGITSPPVSGEFSAREALERLLANSGLRYEFINEKTVRITIMSPTGADAYQAHPTARMTQSGRMENMQKVEAYSPKQALDTPETTASLSLPEDAGYTDIVVTGSRLRSPVHVVAAQPVISYSREDLDRLGVQTFADFQRFVPQMPPLVPTSAPENQLQIEDFNTFGAGLRGMGNTATLVLVDGRRVSKLGQATGADAYSLAGIPMSAVERIDVVTDGASAVYGADAIGGVVNIILRKDYQGTELKTTYGNTFYSDTADRHIHLTHGFRRKDFSFLISATWAEANSLAPRDRDFLASSDFRRFGGLDRRSTVPGGAGVIRSTNGSNLPGLNTSIVAIPRNSTGVNLSIDDYANAGEIPASIDFRQLQEYGQRSSQGARIGGEYALKPWLSIFAEGHLAETTSTTPGSSGSPTGSGIVLNNVTVPADYPGNPFGVPVRVQRVFWEMLPYLSKTFETSDSAVVLGARGHFLDAWSYELGMRRASTSYSAAGALQTGGVLSPTLVAGAIGNPNADLRPIILNDGVSNSPNSPALLKSFLTPDADLQEKPVTKTYDIRVDGSAWSAPGGDATLAVGAEYQQEQVRFALASYPTDNLGRVGTSHERSLMAVYAEIQVPLVGEQQAIPFVESLVANASVRRDHYSDFGGELAPRFSLFYKPSASIGFRVSYGEGFKIPLLTQVTAPQAVSNFQFNGLSGYYDPYRGNEALVGTIPTTLGGNEGLSPETSRSVSARLIVDVPGLRGASVSLDYYDIKYKDMAAAGLSYLQDILALIPHRVSRAEPLPDDQLAGLPGRIVALDLRPINISYVRRSGIDLEFRYEQSYSSSDSVTWRINATAPTASKFRASAFSVERDDLSMQPSRAVASVFWAREALRLGTAITRTSGRDGSAGVPVKSVTLCDFFAGYELPRGESKGSGMWSGLLRNSSVQMSIVNIFDRNPAISASGAIADEVDPRGRRYQLTFAKIF